MKKKLFEVSVVKTDSADNSHILIPTTPLLAKDEEAARYKAMYMATEACEAKLNIDECKVYVRPF